MTEEAERALKGSEVGMSGPASLLLDTEIMILQCRCVVVSKAWDSPDLNVL